MIIRLKKVVIVSRCSSGRSALHHAAIHSLPRCLRLLLARGVCPDVADADGNTPLVLAVIHNRVDAVAMLLRDGCHVDIVGHCTVGDQYVWRRLGAFSVLHSCNSVIINFSTPKRKITLTVIHTTVQEHFLYSYVLVNQ